MSQGWPVLELLDTLAPELQRCVAPDSMLGCRAAARLIPRRAVAHYLELRPGQRRRLDLLSCFVSKQAAADYTELLTGGTDKPLGRVGEVNLELARAWADPRQALSQAPCLWFEYDAADAETAARWEASPSIGLEPGYQSRHHTSMRGVARDALAIVEAALPILVSTAHVAHTLAAVRRCFQALSMVGGSVGYVSVMTARTPAVTKLYVIVPRRATEDYLRAIGWPGEVARARSLMDSLYVPALETAYLDLTLGAGVEPRLGVALSQFHRREAADAAASWPPLPEALAKEHESLRTWPGVTRAAVAGCPTSIRRWLDLKAVLHGDNQVEHKAYLGFTATLPPPFE